MLKKFLAGATAIVLGLGIVTLVAAPAQAHTPHVSGSFQCATPTSGTITWTISNDDQYGPSEVTSVSGNAAGQLSPDPLHHQFTDTAPGDSTTVTQQVTTTTQQTLTIALTWSNDQQTYSNSGSVTPDFSSCSTVTPVKPNVTGATCSTNTPGTVVPGYITFTNFDKVKYQYRIGSGAWTDATSNPTDLPDGTPSVDVKAISGISPYTIVGTPEWDGLIVGGKTPADCITQVTPTPPGVQAQTCVVDQDGTGHFVSGWIFIPDTTGVTYAITIKASGLPAVPTGSQAAPGGTNYFLVPNTYTITATANSGYTLENYTGPWDRMIPVAEACGDLIPHPLVTPEVDSTPLSCSTSVGSYTLTNDLVATDPSATDAIIWTVNGSTVSSGTYQVNGATTVTIHAAANSPTYGLDPGVQTDWTLTFSAPTTCDLKTLALTGTSSPVGWIGLGSLLLLSGLGLLTVYTVRRRTEKAEQD